MIIFVLTKQDLYKVTPAFEILTKGNTQIQATPKPGVPVDSECSILILLNLIS